MHVHSLKCETFRGSNNKCCNNLNGNFKLIFINFHKNVLERTNERKKEIGMQKERETERTIEEGRNFITFKE